MFVSCQIQRTAVLTSACKDCQGSSKYIAETYLWDLGRGLGLWSQHPTRITRQSQPDALESLRIICYKTYDCCFSLNHAN